MHHHDLGRIEDGRDGRNVADEIVIELLVERRVECVVGNDEEQHMTVRRCFHDDFGADISAAARPVLDDEWLAEPLREPLTDQARGDVGNAASRGRDDDAHRPHRIGLRPSEARYGRQRGSARGQVKKSTAGEFHGDPCWFASGLEPGQVAWLLWRT